MRPGVNGTVSFWPPASAAFSMPALPASTIRSAIEIFLPPDCAPLTSPWMPSSVFSTLPS
ncbi:hypothetical protein D3C72_1121880 [compost metagenome]